MHWNTSTEVNNYGFEVQRLINGNDNSHWKDIGFVKGAGNSNSPKKYYFNDYVSDINISNLEYRLKQIDNDGNFKYSKVLTAPLSKPGSFSLSQNYPNPFNPATTINYQIPSITKVTLKIYDILGREVGTLVNEVKNPGKYAVQFNADKLSAGIYFYKFQAGNYAESKKMILVK